ncbi:MAG: hypothetical protein K0Q46_2518 [Rhodococcus erythropolis]|jgi:hypothetical protein|nr:hypothetical protein [Rhodococcus erythropolis]MDF2895732.1 hypothetical protein [Rhodococcus erythropolis]
MTEQTKERAVRLPAPLDYVEVTYPYEWPGFEDAVHLQNDRNGTGSVMHGNYARALAETILDVMGARS